MKKTIYGIIVVLACAFAGPTFADPERVAQTPDVPNIKSEDPAAPERLNRLLEDTRTFSASFTQKVYKPKTKEVVNYKGRFSLKRPNRFRWEVSAPDKQLLVADGRELWFYDEDLSQVTVTPINEAIGSTPAALLSSNSIDVNNKFYVLQLVNTSKTQKFELNPKRSDELITKITITFENNVLSDMLVVDSMGQRSEIHFSNVKMNPALADSLFTYKAPAGVDVIGKSSKKK